MSKEANISKDFECIFFSHTHDTDEDILENKGTEQHPENDVQCRLELAVVDPQVFQQGIPLIHGK